MIMGDANDSEQSRQLSEKICSLFCISLSGRFWKNHKSVTDFQKKRLALFATKYEKNNNTRHPRLLDARFLCISPVRIYFPVISVGVRDVDPSSRRVGDTMFNFLLDLSSRHMSLERKMSHNNSVHCYPHIM